MEDLQMQGATLKKVTRPSDNAVATTEILHLKSASSDNNQYQKNIQHALLNLNTTEQALEQLTEVMVKAKEIAIAQASDFYDGSIRKNVANEVRQLRNHALALSNKRVGQRYIFGGFKTLERPFDNDGKYNGDKGHMNIEVSKDFFVPINLHGKEVFFAEEHSKNEKAHPLNRFPDMENSPNHNIPPHLREIDPVDLPENFRDLASLDDEGNIIFKGRSMAGAEDFQQRDNIFSILDTLNVALMNNSASVIQDLLPKIESSIDRLISMRTRVGSIVNSIQTTETIIEQDQLNKAERKSHLADADIAELFSDITRQQGILRATYQSGQTTLNQRLLDFLR